MVKITRLEAQELINELVNHFLGEDWYIVDPVDGEQANVLILEAIKEKYPSGRIRRIPKKRRKLNVRKY